MGPIVTEVQEKYAGAAVEFVTFDFTSEETTAASAAKAASLGISELYAEKAPKTGFALIYDTQTKQVITQVSAEQDSTAWAGEIDKALGEG